MLEQQQKLINQKNTKWIERDKFLDRRDFELIQMDTDSLYFALSCDSFKEAVRPELREEFQKWKKRMVCLDEMD